MYFGVPCGSARPGGDGWTGREVLECAGRAAGSGGGDPVRCVDESGRRLMADVPSAATASAQRDREGVRRAAGRRGEHPAARLPSACWPSCCGRSSARVRRGRRGDRESGAVWALGYPLGRLGATAEQASHDVRHAGHGWQRGLGGSPQRRRVRAHRGTGSIRGQADAAVDLGNLVAACGARSAYGVRTWFWSTQTRWPWWLTRHLAAVRRDRAWPAIQRPPMPDVDGLGPGARVAGVATGMAPDF